MLLQKCFHVHVGDITDDAVLRFLPEANFLVNFMVKLELNVPKDEVFLVFIKTVNILELKYY